MTETRTEEWLESLRRDMNTQATVSCTEFQYGGPYEERVATLADAFTGLAASYIHPLKARIAELEGIVATELTELGEDESGIPDNCACSFVSGVNYKCPLHGTAPSPEMREVPDRKFEAGDTITVTALAGPRTSWSRGNSNGVTWKDIDLLTELHLRALAEPAIVTVTRPVTPLPDECGAIGTATIRKGTPREERGIMLVRSGQMREPVWFAPGGIVPEAAWLASSEVSDFVRVPHALDAKEG